MGSFLLRHLVDFWFGHIGIEAELAQHKWGRESRECDGENGKLCGWICGRFAGAFHQAILFSSATAVAVSLNGK